MEESAGVSGACGSASRSVGREKFDLCVWSILERGGKGEPQFTERGDVPMCSGRGRDGVTCAAVISVWATCLSFSTGNS